MRIDLIFSGIVIAVGLLFLVFPLETFKTNFKQLKGSENPSNALKNLLRIIGIVLVVGGIVMMFLFLRSDGKNESDLAAETSITVDADTNVKVDADTNVKVIV